MASGGSKKKDGFTCVIVSGMAGSGKTALVQRLVSHLYKTTPPYVINLDPAVLEVRNDFCYYSIDKLILF